MKSKKVIIKILVVLFVLVIGYNINAKKCSAETYVAGTDYELRVGDQYFKTFSDFYSQQYLFMSMTTVEVELLQPEIYIDQSYSSWYLSSNGSTVIFKTGTTDGDYGYQGDAGTNATFVRADGFTDSFFKFTNGIYYFENVDFDGGWGDDKNGIEASDALIDISRAINCTDKKLYFKK